MKNVSLALVSILVGLLPACSAGQEPPNSTSPTPVVTVPPTQTSEPVAEQPKETPVAEVEPPPEEAPSAGGRLAFQQCAEESRKVKGCTKIFQPVCGEVDTGIRCVRAPCPSTAQQTFGNACTACMDAKVRGYWGMSCEDMAKPTAP